jgi:hypothetical protein
MAIFSAEPCSKNAGFFGLRLVIRMFEERKPTPRNPNQKKQPFGGFFNILKYDSQ